MCTRRTPGAAELCEWVKHCSPWWAPCLRCVVTNQDPDSGEFNFNTLKAIVGYRGGARHRPQHPC